MTGRAIRCRRSQIFADRFSQLPDDRLFAAGKICERSGYADRERSVAAIDTFRQGHCDRTRSFGNEFPREKIAGTPKLLNVLAGFSELDNALPLGRFRVRSQAERLYQFVAFLTEKGETGRRPDGKPPRSLRYEKACRCTGLNHPNVMSINSIPCSQDNGFACLFG